MGFCYNLATMKQIDFTQYFSYFRSRNDMLIFEGYCQNARDVVVYKDGNNFLLLANFGFRTDCCIVGDDHEFLQKCLPYFHGNVKFCGLTPTQLQFFRSRYKFLWQTDCYLCVWDGKPMPVLPNSHQMGSLSVEHAQQVSNGTPYLPPVEEVEECIVNRPSSALFVDGKPVCWCLLHLEKSLGMLYTLPEHRKKGYALHVMVDLCNKVLQNGDVPFAYIVQSNVASLALGKKYNLHSVGESYYFEIAF